MKKIILYFIIFTLLISNNCFSQATLKTRPKIALVLSGGGAKGLAEIPLIEAIEEEGIPIDMVLGTSMGSLLGSLYAAGYSPKEIRETMLHMDFMGILNDSTATLSHIPREAFSTHTDSRLTLNFGYKKVGAGPGVIGDQKILRELNDHLVKVMEIKDFDKLNKQFRAIATDISNGECIIFKSGSIVDAVRGSMSLPGIFTPAPTADGKYVMDGGLRNNIPIQIAKEMGADIIIAMDVASATEVDPKQIDNMVSVGVLVFNMIISSNAVEQHKIADLLYRPDLSKFSTMDFAHIKGIIKAGEDCVTQKKDELHALALKIEKLGVKLEKQDPNRISHYASLPDKKIKKITIRDISMEKDGSLPDEKHFAKFVGMELNDKTRNLLSEELSKMRDKYHLASLSYETYKTLKDDELNLEIKANYYNLNMSKIFMGGQSSMSLTTSSNETRFKIKPDFTIGMFALKPFEFSWKVFFGNTNGINVLLMPKIAKTGPAVFSFIFENNFYYGSLEPASNILNDNRIANEDKGLTFQTGFMLRLLDFMSLKGGFNYELSHIYRTNCEYNVYSLFGEFAFDNTFGDCAPFSGLKIDAILKSGNYVGTNKKITSVFAFRYRQANSIPIIKNWTSFGYDFAINTMHYPYVLNSGFADIGGIEGMCGYLQETMKRDSFIAGIKFQQKIKEFSGMPLFLLLNGKICGFDSYDINEDYNKTPPKNYFDGFSWEDDLIYGFGTYIGLKTRWGNLMLGGSANSKGKWYITLGFM